MYVLSRNHRQSPDVRECLETDSIFVSLSTEDARLQTNMSQFFSGAVHRLNEGYGVTPLLPPLASPPHERILQRDGGQLLLGREGERSLARLLSDVTESCQSWLDEKVFRGVFGTAQNQDQEQDLDLDLDMDLDLDLDQARSSRDEKTWLNSTELEDSRSFTYVPPPSPFYTNSCCPASPEHTGLTMKALLLFIFTLFLFTALYSGCLLWSATVTSTVFLMITSFMRHHIKKRVKEFLCDVKLEERCRNIFNISPSACSLQVTVSSGKHFTANTLQL
ncbi:hypothetical protein F7725_010946 [Dissostichus mawsoni]|uniref:Uncharacterized protein n=1 Tax=Dissostichus mawsoni TaxID=36200 RepID=A0A7J5Z7K3_DISMA|nr:hypothetical protein F7725_010946 [Dissostichus mawsoni]